MGDNVDRKQGRGSTVNLERQNATTKSALRANKRTPFYCLRALSTVTPVFFVPFGSCTSRGRQIARERGPERPAPRSVVLRSNELDFRKWRNSARCSRGTFPPGFERESSARKPQPPVPSEANVLITECLALNFVERPRARAYLFLLAFATAAADFYEQLYRDDDDRKSSPAARNYGTPSSSFSLVRRLPLEKKIPRETKGHRRVVGFRNFSMASIDARVLDRIMESNNARLTCIPGDDGLTHTAGASRGSEPVVSFLIDKRPAKPTRRGAS